MQIFAFVCFLNGFVDETLQISQTYWALTVIANFMIDNERRWSSAVVKVT